MSLKKCHIYTWKSIRTRLFVPLLCEAPAKGRQRLLLAMGNREYRGDHVMWFQAKNVCLFSMMHGGSESLSQHNTATPMWLFNSLWRHFWIWVVSLCQTFFHTHSGVGETPPGGVMTMFGDKFEVEMTNEQGVGKNESPHLRITQSGGNARPRESASLSGVWRSLWSGSRLMKWLVWPWICLHSKRSRRNTAGHR